MNEPLIFNVNVRKVESAGFEYSGLAVYSKDTKTNELELLGISLTLLGA